MGMKVNNYMVSENYGRSNSKKNKENVSPIRDIKKKTIKKIISNGSNCTKKQSVSRRPQSGSGVAPFQHIQKVLETSANLNR